MLLVLAVGTSRAACAAAAAATTVATMPVATVYRLLYGSDYGVLLLAVHIPERLAAACYLLWSLPTKYKTCQETYKFFFNVA